MIGIRSSWWWWWWLVELSTLNRAPRAWLAWIQYFDEYSETREEYNVYNRERKRENGNFGNKNIPTPFRHWKWMTKSSERAAQSSGCRLPAAAAAFVVLLLSLQHQKVGLVYMFNLAREKTSTVVAAMAAAMAAATMAFSQRESVLYYNICMHDVH